MMTGTSIHQYQICLEPEWIPRELNVKADYLSRIVDYDGGYVVEHGGSISHGQWSAEDSRRSSTWRELSAVWLVLLSVAAKLVNARVHWFTDNRTVTRILRVGSRNVPRFA